MFSIDFIASKKLPLVCLEDMSKVEKSLIITFSIL
jgi:hypothetical protein